MQRLKVSVIIPAYNAADTLAEGLTALQNQSWNREWYEILVVDDGSTDRTAEIAQRYAVRLLQQPNAGPAAARNRGAQAAQGEILLFTDADCVPAPDWIEQMIAPFADPAVQGGKGVYRTRQRAWVARFVQYEYESRYDRMSGQDAIDFIDTYSAAYRRESFLAHGGFDTRFPTASVEDQEFSFRLARAGCRMVFIPQAVVYHQHDANLREYIRRKFDIGYWKALLLRWHPERAVRDSHTPQRLKVQIGLLGMGIAFLPLIWVWAPALWITGGAALLFLLTILPFWWRVAVRDRPVALVAPLLLLLRALSLGLGLVTGWVRFSLFRQGRGING